MTLGIICYQSMGAYDLLAVVLVNVIYSYKLIQTLTSQSRRLHSPTYNVQRIGTALSNQTSNGPAS